MQLMTTYLKQIVATLFMLLFMLSSVAMAHENHEVNEDIAKQMKQMGKALRVIRKTDDKDEILSALTQMQTAAEDAKGFEAYVIRDGLSDKSQADYENGLQKFIDNIEAIKVEVGMSDRVDGGDIFKKVRDMKDNSHEYFSVD
ncbi:cytochrome b562 [Ostreibacterium oceani]|nr:cytochrome b562 [Ostreibacterium oceani]